MNAKFAVALILALQVSLSLCEAPTPSAGLLDKYKEMKETFGKRMAHFFDGVRTSATETMDEANQNQKVHELIEEVSNTTQAIAIIGFLGGLAEHSGPVVDLARTTFLGLYEQHLRGEFGTELDKFINQRLKPFLDKIFPLPATKVPPTN